MKIEWALISVSNKDGLSDLGRGLGELGIQCLSTGGTARALREAGVEVTPVSDYTGFPEILDGRVKTLHPRIHAGILARHDLASHRDVLTRHEIQPLGMVVVNLYPFVETVSREGVTLEDAIEQIDIGGPCMVRAAAKNWAHVTVVVDPSDYPSVLAELSENGGETRTVHPPGPGPEGLPAYGKLRRGHLSVPGGAERVGSRSSRHRDPLPGPSGPLALRGESASAGRHLPAFGRPAAGTGAGGPAPGEEALVQQLPWIWTRLGAWFPSSRKPVA